MNHDSSFVTQEGYAVRVAPDVFLAIHDIHNYTTFSVKPVPMARARLYPRPLCLSAGEMYYVADFMKREGYVALEWVHVTQTVSYSATEGPSAPERQSISELT